MFPRPNNSERKQIARAIFGDDNRWDDIATKAYFDHYFSILCPETPGDAVINIEIPALRGHTDVTRCVDVLRQDPFLSFDEFVVKATGSEQVNSKEKEYIADLTVDIKFMFKCYLKDYHSVGLKGHDLGWVKWEKNVRFTDFTKEAFTRQLVTTEEQKYKNADTIRNKKHLKAWKLKRRYGITIRPTDNLLEHLSYDPSTRILKVFHQHFFLRTQLELTKDSPLDLGFEDSLKLGTLPPKLLLETLLTFHVLFPIKTVGDKKSHSSLKRMIKKYNFDPETEIISFVRPVPSDMVFEYWGDRLTKLYDTVKRPPPTNPIVSWFERHTSERNALTAAILGLFLAALFGFLSFVVGLLQLILAWVAWKHPN